ncbi:MAG: SGNH/GDSL hydrolase family protein [Sphingomonadales bacterium]|nr:SGNH/GDSL hydrolase family protein [Sphingomonadales bacterium]
MTLFAKGNVDVHDSLHSCRVGGQLQWNGINEIIRPRYPGVTMRVQHETLTRFDALLAADGVVPPVFDGHDLSLGTYPLTSQFSDKVFTSAPDAVILSILPDVASQLVRHRRDGFRFNPANASTWAECEREWLKSEFEPIGTMRIDDAIANLAAIIERLRQDRDVPVLVYNMSAVIPGDRVHCYLGLDETYATRIRRFNLALIELSAELGFSIVDVDAVLARNGAERLKLDVMHLHPEGYRLIAEEVVRILDDLGVLEE